MPENNPEASTQTIAAHLSHITERWHELGQDCLLEVVHLSADDRAQVKDVSYYRADQIEDAAKHITVMNGYGHNSYATVNPVDAANRPPAGKRSNAEHIVASFFHFADADTKEAANNILNFVGPKSTFYVLTGTQPTARPHVYWQLEEPTRNLAAWSETQHCIKDTLATDAVTDPPRIMRVAGTVNWPKPQKISKGYVAEITALHIYDPDERPAVSSERMARAFQRNSSSAATGTGLQIDTGPQPMDRERAAIQALSGQEWNNAVLRLVGSYVRKGMSDGEIHALTDPLTLGGYSVAETRVEVQDMIDRTRSNPKFDVDAEEPAPVVATPEAITSFKIDSSEAFLSDLRPLEYLIDGILPRGVAYSLTGHAGHGKTTLALQIALSVAMGESFDGRETSQGRVLILAGENPYNVKWQYAAALAALDLSAKDVPIDFVQGRFSIKEWGEVVRAKMEAMPDLKLVVVDSLQAFFEGDNDNDNAQMVEMAHKLRDLCETSNRPALLIIAHPAGKVASKDNLVPRGGGAFLNEIDGNLTVWSQDASQQTLHHSQKFRGAGFDPMEFVMQIHEFSHLTDIHGTPLKLPVSRPETHLERSNREVKTDGILRQYLEKVEQGHALSVREGSAQFMVSRYRIEQIIKTARDEKLIRRHAKTYVITEGGKDFLEAKDAGV